MLSQLWSGSFFFLIPLLNVLKEKDSNIWKHKLKLNKLGIEVNDMTCINKLLVYIILCCIILCNFQQTWAKPGAALQIPL